MLTDLHRKTAQAIVNIFETGRAQGDYGKVTLLAGDTGHLTYGRSQTTLASGNLYLLIKAYVAAPGAACAAALSPYLPRIEDIDLGLDRDMAFRALLQDAGGDPVMHDVQDGFFDRVYWQPAIRSADFIGVTTPLGTAVVYDSRIHGSWHRMRDRTVERHGKLTDSGEQPWIGRYVTVRRDWLANHSNTLLRKTVYRMDAFRRLIESDAWNLDLPLHVRGVRIDEDVLDGPAEVRASAEVAEERMLRLRTPFMQGEDVREVQEALANAGIDVDTDGVFGPATARAVTGFQREGGLTADGIVGAATRAALGL
jgi:chitosanase